jgi:hypothetical protein
VAVQPLAKASEFVEHRVATPRADLVVVRFGKSRPGAALRETEKSGALIDGIVRATRKPGISRDSIFKARKGKRVYAYSISPGDVTKFVREDVKGRKTVGRLVQGEFKPLRSQTV